MGTLRIDVNFLEVSPRIEASKLTSRCDDISTNIVGHEKSTQILHQMVYSGLRGIVDEFLREACQPAGTPDRDDLTCGLILGSSLISGIQKFEESHRSRKDGHCIRLEAFLPHAGWSMVEVVVADFLACFHQFRTIPLGIPTE